jgi:hypothetical protein
MGMDASNALFFRRGTHRHHRTTRFVFNKRAVASVFSVTSAPKRNTSTTAEIYLPLGAKFAPPSEKSIN